MKSKSKSIFFMASTSLLFFIPIMTNAAFIDLNASSSSVGLGSDFDITFTISSLSNSQANSMSGFDLDILFDNNVLSLIDYSFDDPFLGNSLDLTEPDALPFFGSVREFGGVIDASAVSGNSGFELDQSQANGFTFLTMKFNALAMSAGTSILLDTFDPYLLFSDSALGQLDVSFGNTELIINIYDSSISVSEPASLGLLGLGLLAIYSLRRRPISQLRNTK